MGPQAPCQCHTQSFVWDPGLFCLGEGRDVGESDLSIMLGNRRGRSLSSRY